MRQDEVDFSRYNRRQSYGQTPRGHRRRWPFFLLFALLLVLAFAITRYVIETSSDQSYVGPDNKTFFQIVIGPNAMAPTLEHVQITTYDNKGHIVHKTSCYAEVGTQLTLEYQQQDVYPLQSLLGFHSGIRLSQVEGCAPQLSCLLHANAKCAAMINKDSGSTIQVAAKTLPFTIPQTGTRKVTYNVVTTQDGFAVSS
ncbi:MAG: hypothetical protein WCD86_14930 [Ktedonobacteraceae bacterium]